jgi:hypothetical protein
MVAALPNIHHDPLVMDEIRAALAVGKEVTTHTDDISVLGWTGAGYVIIDPQSGIGAYKIGGGENGSHYSDDSDKDSAFSIFISLLSEFGNDLQKLISKFVGHILMAFDVSKIWKACDSWDEKAGGLLAYAIYSGAIAGLMWAITSPLVVIPIFLVAFFAVLFTLIMSFMVDTIVSDCREY